MKLIIAGGRDFNDYELLEEKVDLFLYKVLDGYTLSNINTHNISIICGMQKGADTLGKQFGEKYNLEVIEKPADWNTHNKSAGPIRNNQMADICTHAIIFWDGSSRGSKNMIDICIQRNIPHKVIKY